MTRLEDWQSSENQPVNATTALRLSQSVQEMFKPNTNFAGQGDLFQALDFGTGADLYRSAAYTGDRLSASTFMTDEPEQKTDAPKLDPAFESLRRPSVLRTKEDEANWAKTQELLKLGKDESATHIGLPPEVIADMQKKGQASKLEIVGLSADSDQKPELIAQGFKFPNVVEIYKQEFEHKYRGKELATMEKDIPKEKWDEAYKAFPELKQLGEKDATRLMKAIIANELDHYGAEDVTQDAAAKTGHGGGLHRQSIGYGQISPDGIRDMAKQFDQEVAQHHRTSNPLAKYEKMSDDQLAKELANPANAPLFVAAHMALDMKNLNKHKSEELHVTPAALGYWYNADMAYAKSDKNHEHLMTKKEAQAKHIPYDPALPTDTVLEKSEHAKNIRKWLEKVN